MLTSLSHRVRSRLRPTAPLTVPAAPEQPGTESVMTDDEKRIVADVRFYTMVSTERLLATMDAVEYVVANGIPGALVECGVWRGGSVLAMVRTLQRLGVDDRDVYLYDTFEGMTEPEPEDTSPFEPDAVRTWAETPSGTTPWGWAFDRAIYDLEFVRGLLKSTGYPAERLHFVQGPVEQTVPATVPDAIAVLRLDTDWYASTLHELTHLYPLLPAGGVLIVDDYGHWDGARQAVEEYFAGPVPAILLTRTDYTGRMGVKRG